MIDVGAVVAGYVVESILGTGGMGTVYLVQNPELPRRDALKVLSAHLSLNREFRARFIREADIAASLAHPNIVSIYDRGETEDGQLWIAMQYVNGIDAEAAHRRTDPTVMRSSVRSRLRRTGLERVSIAATTVFLATCTHVVTGRAGYATEIAFPGARLVNGNELPSLLLTPSDIGAIIEAPTPISTSKSAFFSESPGGVMSEPKCAACFLLVKG
jgi:Protein kinase domain